MAILGRLIRDMRARPGMFGSVKARSSSSPTKVKVLREYANGIDSSLMALLSRRMAGISCGLSNTEAVGMDGVPALGLVPDEKTMISRASTRVSASS